MKPELRYQVITVFRIVRRAGKANKTVRRGHGLPFERPLLTAKVNIFGTHPEKKCIGRFFYGDTLRFA